MDEWAKHLKKNVVRFGRVFAVGFGLICEHAPSPPSTRSLNDTLSDVVGFEFARSRSAKFELIAP